MEVISYWCYVLKSWALLVILVLGEYHKTPLKSTLLQVMVLCCQATRHCLSQSWPRCMPPYSGTRPQWAEFLHVLVANLMSLIASLVTTSWMHQSNNRLTDIYGLFLFLWLLYSIWNKTYYYYYNKKNIFIATGSYVMSKFMFHTLTAMDMVTYISCISNCNNSTTFFYLLLLADRKISTPCPHSWPFVTGIYWWLVGFLIQKPCSH